MNNNILRPNINNQPQPNNNVMQPTINPTPNQNNISNNNVIAPKINPYSSPNQISNNQVINNQPIYNQMPNPNTPVQPINITTPPKSPAFSPADIILGLLSVIPLTIEGFKYLAKPKSSSSDNSNNNLTSSQRAIARAKMPTGNEKKSFLDQLKNILSPQHVLSQKEITKLEEERHQLQKELALPSAKIVSKPTIYVYKVKDKNGNILTGRFTGFSKLDVNSFLLNEGYEVYSIKNNKWIDFVYGEGKSGAAKHVSNKNLIFWLTQLSTYIKSGIPLNDAIKILINQMGNNKANRMLFQSISYELTLGNPFSVALDKQGGAFPPLLINMLKAAEATGQLEETLEDMSNYYDEIEKTRKEMISALTYPTLVTVFAIGVVTFIILYVVPKFQDIYRSNGMTLTGLTAFLINLSAFLKQYIGFILAGLVLVSLGLYISYKNNKEFRRNVQILAMKLPVIGNIIIYNEMTIFTKTFASLLKNNVYITESIDILSKITNNEIYKEIMIKTIDNIARGDKISDAFKDQWAVPEVAYYMIVTGESTGQLAEMMSRVSSYYQTLHKSIVNQMKSIIEPVMIVVLAVMVGGIILAVIMPMFQLYNSIL